MKPPEPRALLVEDEESILEGLFTLFSSQGFSADRADNGRVASEKLAHNDYDLVILDLMIPEVNGLDVLREARARGIRTPVLILTAKGAEEDIVAGLEAGADDYVTKPFGVRELVARARGLLRRAEPAGGEARTIRVGEVTVDLDNLVLTWSQHQLRLTAREGLLLDFLYQHRARPVTREELLVHVWGYQTGNVRTRTVDVHIQQLRKKLGDVPEGDTWISTVRGRGYRFSG